MCLGLINVDFVDVCIVMLEMGKVMMGSGVVSGLDCVEEVVEFVIVSLLLEDIDLLGVCGILVNIIVGLDFVIDEFEMVGNVVKVFVFENVIVVVGIVIDMEMIDEFCVIVVVMGIGVECKLDIFFVSFEGFCLIILVKEYGSSIVVELCLVVGGIEGN